MPKPMVYDYWYESANEEEGVSSRDAANLVSISLDPTRGENYRPCLDIVLTGPKKKGTIRMALNPILEDIASDFFQTLEAWKGKDNSIEPKRSERKNKRVHSRPR